MTDDAKHPTADPCGSDLTDPMPPLPDADVEELRRLSCVYDGWETPKNAWVAFALRYCAAVKERAATKEQPMTDLVLRLREQLTSGHVKRCQGREYTCDCGYDLVNEGVIELAATEIETLRARVEAADLEYSIDYHAHNLLKLRYGQLERECAAAEARAAELERRLADAVKALDEIADFNATDPWRLTARCMKEIARDARAAARALTSIQKNETTPSLPVQRGET